MPGDQKRGGNDNPLPPREYSNLMPLRRPYSRLPEASAGPPPEEARPASH
jgi:hypothetical protein